jgi:hypothetical protein
MFIAVFIILILKVDVIEFEMNFLSLLESCLHAFADKNIRLQSMGVLTHYLFCSFLQRGLLKTKRDLYDL